MKFRILVLFLLLILSCTSMAQLDGPFSVTPKLIKGPDGWALRVSYESESENAYFYKSSLAVDSEENVKLVLKDSPVSKKKYDQFSEAEVEVYDHQADYVYRIVGEDFLPLKITVSYQGCDDRFCYAPVSKKFSLDVDLLDAVSSVTADSVEFVISDLGATGVMPSADRFAVLGSAAGYMSADEFVEFLDDSEAGQRVSRGRLRNVLDTSGVIVLSLLVLLFGLGLNLTPCVLPMIPVNIAIIGAGAQSGTKARGFALGATYGLGIALSYGVLGVLFVLSGTRFGTLNSDPVFNIAIGLIFLLLSLAMFGVFHLDFTRFQGKVDADKSHRSSFMTAFVLGCISALLAGACVAPVVISTLVLALDIYTKGGALGLFLPFLLGLGMAVPWPFAGAGLSFLPKAGMWMEKVKYGFGAIIMIAAVYYIGLGSKLAMDNTEANKNKVIAAQSESAKDGWVTSLEKGMILAKKENKHIIIDFWASWCKNCLKMEKTTFKDQEVLNRMDGYIKVKFDASDQKDPAVKQVLDRYVSIGLPTYVLLKYEE